VSPAPWYWAAKVVKVPRNPKKKAYRKKIQRML
jgi:hypothetical protein